MKHRSSFSYGIIACALLFRFSGAARTGAAGGTGSRSIVDRVPPLPLKASGDNDYLASTVRRMQALIDADGEDPSGNISDRRGRGKSCVIDGGCSSTYYYYKDFAETGGTTLAQAYAATGSAPDLEGCVLAPVYSYDDLVEVSDAIPPCTAAYTAAYKDPGTVFREAQDCVQDGRIPYNCDFSPLGEALDALWGSDSAGTFGACSLEDWFGDDYTSGLVWCPALRDNWSNLGGDEAVPSDLWREGDSTYCGEGPILNAAAAFATDYATGTPTASLKALSAGEYLPGAVYRCCLDGKMACYSD